MKAFTRLVCTLMVAGCVSVYAQQDVVLQTSPILAKEVFKRQFTVVDFEFSPVAAWYQDYQMLSDIVLPKNPKNPFGGPKEDEYRGPPSAIGFIHKTLTAALVDFDYLGAGDANYKISGNIEQL
jgi:hypothetical protein